MGKARKINLSQPGFFDEPQPQQPEAPSPLKDLIAVRQIFDAAGSWTMGAIARDAEQKPISPLSDDARQWCLRGAILRVLGYDDDARYIAVERAILPMTRTGLVIWNDNYGSEEPPIYRGANASGKGQSAVCVMLDDVIAKVMEEEGASG